MEMIVADAYFQEEEREGFTVPAMMKRCWAAECKMLCIIDEICKRHGIRWWVDYGSLLGAVRHRGFVPWDDDMDISMMREDYNRAIPILRKELPEGWSVEVFGEEMFRGPWTYIRNRDLFDVGCDAKQAEITKQFFDVPYVTLVDLYPIDYVPADPVELDTLMAMHEALFGASVLYDKLEEDGLLEWTLGQIEEMTGQKLPSAKEEVRRVTGRLDTAVMQMYSREESIGVNVIGNMHMEAPRWREFSWYEKTVYLPFEMIEVPVPAGYLKLLESNFGANWMAPVKGTAKHDYPFYMKQEGLIEDFWQKQGLSRPNKGKVGL